MIAEDEGHDIMVRADQAMHQVKRMARERGSASMSLSLIKRMIYLPMNS